MLDLWTVCVCVPRRFHGPANCSTLYSLLQSSSLGSTSEMQWKRAVHSIALYLLYSFLLQIRSSIEIVNIYSRCRLHGISICAHHAMGQKRRKMKIKLTCNNNLRSINDIGYLWATPFLGVVTTTHQALEQQHPSATNITKGRIRGWTKQQQSCLQPSRGRRPAVRFCAETLQSVPVFCYHYLLAVLKVGLLQQTQKYFPTSQATSKYASKELIPLEQIRPKPIRMGKKKSWNNLFWKHGGKRSKTRAGTNGRNRSQISFTTS